MRIKVTKIVVIFSIIMLLYVNYYTVTGYDAKNVVKQVLKIQYGSKDRKLLERISTAEFQQNIGKDFFRKGFFYHLNNNFMRTYTVIDSNTVSVTITVDDFYGRYYEDIRLVKKSENKYLVSSILSDK